MATPQKAVIFCDIPNKSAAHTPNIEVRLSLFLANISSECDTQGKQTENCLAEELKLMKLKMGC